MQMNLESVDTYDNCHEFLSGDSSGSLNTTDRAKSPAFKGYLNTQMAKSGRISIPKIQF